MDSCPDPEGEIRILREDLDRAEERMACFLALSPIEQLMRNKELLDLEEDVAYYKDELEYAVSEHVRYSKLAWEEARKGF